MNQLGFDPEKLFARYNELQKYVHWCEDDARRIQFVSKLVQPAFASLIDDFYDEISNHPAAHQVISGGPEQIARLKKSLHGWLMELFEGRYDVAYLARRWRVGLRHVEIGLDQVYTNVALSRLRSGLLTALDKMQSESTIDQVETRKSLNKLLDLDLAIIEDAYQFAFIEREQRTERLMAIGQMAGGVAHELRNPLNVIKTSVYFLLNTKSLTPQKSLEHLQRIERQVGLADKVVTALSEFTKLPLPKVQSISSEACIAEAIEISELPSSIEVVIDIPDDMPAITADPDLMRIVLTNLIRNARDAMSDSGSLSVTADIVNGAVEVAVSDTGVGIAPEALRRIMEPLYSTKARGLGLGLAISRVIIEKHQGRLLVNSKQGVGSTFTIRLPIIRE